MIIKRKRGDTYDVLIGVVDKRKAVIPLTTEEFTLSVSSIEEPTAAADIFTSVGSIVDATNGKVGFPIPADTPAGYYFFDIEMVDTASKKRTISEGNYILTQDITK